MTKQDDGLFLLEVLVDKIVFVKSPCFSDKEFKTCINIQCLDVDPLEICDDDPTVCIAKSGGPFVKTFNSGKSCLFSLKEADIAKAMNKFPVHVSVWKSLPCGCLPTKIIMGEATIDMTKEFVEARKRFLTDPNSVTYQALKDSFRITGPDGAEAGEIVMFLRISCFGKLIITHFQGSSGPPHLGAGGSSSIVDRSCNPPKEFQTKEDPCACGAAHGSGSAGHPNSGGVCRGGGRGPCPLAQDPYNSMPCEDPDDPCYCTGPKPQGRQQLACRNTDQYCLHLPKGALPSLPFYQEFAAEKQHAIKATSTEMKKLQMCQHKQLVNMTTNGQTQSQDRFEINDPSPIFIQESKLSTKPNGTEERSILKQHSIVSLCKHKFKKHNILFSNTTDQVSDTYSESLCSKYTDSKGGSNIFGTETTVYMTLYDNYCPSRTSGTQATASINKCLQFNGYQVADSRFVFNEPVANSINGYHSITSTLNRDTNKTKVSNYQEIYFFGRKKDNTGMGTNDSKRKTTAAIVQSTKGSSTQAQYQNSSSAVQTKTARGSSAGTNTATGRTVCIKSEKCPATEGNTKGDMIATVSHIKIGPRIFCPIHGRDPCQGPNCVLATTPAEQAPVKITQASNPRRGVFELVIRKMTGAPLAKNELMLEWTPPPCRMPTCAGAPCPPGPCSPSGRPSKCKMIVCRSAPCRTKCCKRKPCGPRPIGPRPCTILCGPQPCRKSCGPSPCSPCGRGPCCSKPCRGTNPCPSKSCYPSPCRPRSCIPRPCGQIPCQRFCKTSCGGNPCITYSLPCRPRPTSRPCQPSRCAPFPPTRCAPCPAPPPCKVVCASSCCQNPCGSPCKSSPCLRPCPVGRRRPRKTRSQPKVRAHRKRISPCLNRSTMCPVVRCRSMPGPCLSCCPPLPCPPRKCCSVFPAKCF